jgi:inactivated superfamily I helicase
MDFQSSFANDNENESPTTHEVSEEESTSTQLRRDRQAAVQTTATQLESILNDVKGTTKRLLDEISTYLDEAESVTVDYMRCQESQRKEARRLEAVQPDVEGATHRFLQQAQAQLAMAAAGHMTTNNDEVELETTFYNGNGDNYE